MKTFVVLTVFFLMFGMIPTAAQAYTVREPVYAGGFYPKDARSLEKAIRHLLRQAGDNITTPTGNHPLKALILPHAGYIYSGRTAARGVRVLEGKTIKRVVLMGPDHRVGFTGVGITGAEQWKSPLGSVPVDPAGENLSKRNPQRFRWIPESDRSEHSLEVILPFLQTVLSSFSLVPLTVGQDNPSELSADLMAVIDASDPQTLWVASSDLSHYLPYDKAVQTDKQTIDLILEGKKEALSAKSNAACGHRPILCLMALAEQNGWKPFLIDYSNSGDTAGDKSRVVGYTAIAYYGGFPMDNDQTKPSQDFDAGKGRILIELARETISRKLGHPAPIVTIPDDPVFKSRRGTFVTLKIDNQLRGCIGNLSSDDSVVEGVRRNALNAAFGDYRFSPLSEDELDHVDIEVSILTEPQPLAHSGGRDLLTKLRPHIDGVIIRKGSAGATFLPQVWEQLPDPSDFLRHLCMKAGLSSDAWTSEDLSVSTYQVQYFEEER